MVKPSQLEEGTKTTGIWTVVIFDSILSKALTSLHFLVLGGSEDTNKQVCSLTRLFKNKFSTLASAWLDMDLGSIHRAGVVRIVLPLQSRVNLTVKWQQNRQKSLGNLLLKCNEYLWAYLATHVACDPWRGVGAGAQSRVRCDTYQWAHKTNPKHQHESQSTEDWGCETLLHYSRRLPNQCVNHLNNSFKQLPRDSVEHHLPRPQINNFVFRCTIRYAYVA